MGAALGALGLVVLILAIALALDARTAYANLGSAAEDVTALQQQVLAGDREAAAATAAALQESTAAAREALHGPHWDLLAAGPALGENVTAVQVVAQVVDDIAHDALAALVDATEVVDPAKLAPVDGRIDLDPIIAVAPQVVAADEALQRARDTLGALDTTVLADRLRGPVEDLTAQVDDLASLTATASRAVQLLPPMLGAEEPRDYLLLVQNNAEPRATGGIPGSVVHLRAGEGAVELIEQRSASSMGDFGDPVLELGHAEEGLYGTQLGRYMQDVTFTPDFPRSAQLAREMWRRETGLEVDGVLSIDPVALQHLLGATGPVTLPAGQVLTGDDAAQSLLNQVYIDVEDPAEQDAFFAMAAETIFARLLTGGAEPSGVVAALDRSADEGRLMVWSARAEEQARLADTVLSGGLRGQHGGEPVVGIFLNDTSGAKIAYYEEVEAEVTATDCGPNGFQHLTVSVAVTSSVPVDHADLPDYLTGGGVYVPEGEVHSQLLVYAPDGASITASRFSDPAGNSAVHVHDGLAAGDYRIALARGETATAEYDIALPRRATDVRTRMTPGPSDDQFSVSTFACGE